MAKVSEAPIDEQTESSKELPSDLFSDVIPQEEALPLDGEVKEKNYTSLPNEAEINNSQSAGAESSPSQNGDALPGPESAAPEGAPVEPEKTPEEIQSQAAQTVDLILKGYEKLHGLGRYMGKVDQSELSTLHAKGKIDLNQELPLGRKSIRIGQFFEEYNQGIDENIVVTDEFKNAIRPALTRIAIRRKWFVSDELYCMLLLAEDATTKISMLVGLKKSANMVLDACIEMQKKINTKTNDAKDGEYEFVPEDGGEWKEPEGNN